MSFNLNEFRLCMYVLKNVQSAIAYTICKEVTTYWQKARPVLHEVRWFSPACGTLASKYVRDTQRLCPIRAMKKRKSSECGVGVSRGWFDLVYLRLCLPRWYHLTWYCGKSASRHGPVHQNILGSKTRCYNFVTNILYHITTGVSSHFDSLERGIHAKLVGIQPRRTHSLHNTTFSSESFRNAFHF